MMNLTQQLNDLRAQNQARIPAEARQIMANATEDMVNSGMTDTSLNVGDRIPEFALPNATGKTVQITDLLAKGAVVISFYRGEWCPYCNLELRSLQQVLPEIQAEGAALVAISPQTPDHSLSTAEKNDLSFDVLSDVGNQVARQFGLVFQLPEALRPVYESFGIDLPAYNGDRTFELPIAATYVVAPSGDVIHAFVNPDYTQRLDPSEIVQALKAQKVAASQQV